jgi:hypothetical protein
MFIDVLLLSKAMFSVEIIFRWQIYAISRKPTTFSWNIFLKETKMPFRCPLSVFPQCLESAIAVG